MFYEITQRLSAKCYLQWLTKLYTWWCQPLGTNSTSPRFCSTTEYLAPAARSIDSSTSKGRWPFLSFSFSSSPVINITEHSWHLYVWFMSFTHLSLVVWCTTRISPRPTVVCSLHSRVVSPGGASRYALYADDSQIYTSVAVSDITSAVHCLAACIADVNNWMSASRLRFNPSKT